MVSDNKQDINIKQFDVIFINRGGSPRKWYRMQQYMILQ